MNISLKLFRLVRPVLPQMLLALLLAFFSAASQAALMGAAAYLIAAAALHPPLYTLSTAIVGVRFFGLARAALRYGERCVSHDATFRILSRLRAETYLRLENLPPLAPRAANSARSCDALVHQVDVLKDFYLRALLPLATAVILTALTAGVLFLYAPASAWPLLLALLLNALVIPCAARRANRRDAQAAKTDRRRLQSVCLDAIRGNAELTVSGGSAALFKRLADAESAANARRRRIFSRACSEDALAEITAAFAAIAALYAAIPLVHNQQFSGVQLAVLTLILLSVMENTLLLPAAWRHWDAAGQAARDLTALPEPANRKPAADFSGRAEFTALEADSLRFSYPRQAPLLRQCTFSLRGGERAALVGGSAAGKSTLLSLLLAAMPAAGGSLRINGVPYAEMTPEAVRSHFSAAPQRGHIFRETIRDNFRLLCPDASEEDIRAALRLAGLEAPLHALAQGLDTPVGQSGGQLSGGQRQRLRIAVALARRAPVLLLDEPTDGLDALTARALMQTIDNLPASKTVLLITHDVDLLHKMDRIFVLHEGRIAEQGNFAALIKRRGIFYRLWRAG